MALESLSGLRGLSSLGRSQSLITPEEESSLLDEIVGGVGSALGVVGGVLDTPGAFVRNILAGRNPLPGIFDTDERISGRELLEQHGILDRNTAGFDVGDVLGFGAEVVTDPFILVGGGVTKAGSLAKELGKFPKRSVMDLKGGLELGKRTARRNPLRSVLEGADDATMELARTGAAKRGTTLDALMDEPMQRSVGVGLPFQENAFTFDLPGAAGRAAAMDKVGSIIGASLPGQLARKGFDYAVRNVGDGKFGAQSQEAATRVTESLDSAMPEVEIGMDRMSRDIMEAGLTPDETRDLFEQVVHGNPNMPRGKLTPEQSVAFNVKPRPGETNESLALRRDAAMRALTAHNAQNAKLFDERVKRGLAKASDRFDSPDRNYAYRSATFPGYNEANSAKARTIDADATVVNSAVKDPALRKLTAAIDVDLLDHESISKGVDDATADKLREMGFDHLDELTDWQGKGIVNAQGATGRTVAPPDQINREAMSTAIDYTRRNHLGGPADLFDREGIYRDAARLLPGVRKELEELQELAASGHERLSLPERAQAIQEKIAQSEADRAAYVERKADLDARDFESRDDYIPDDEIRQLATLRASGDRLPNLRAQLKRVQERIDGGETVTSLADEIATATDNLSLAEEAAANVRAINHYNDVSKELVRLNKSAPQEVFEKGRNFFGNDPVVDAKMKAMGETRRMETLDQLFELVAAHATRQQGPMDPSMMRLDQAIKALGAGTDATKLSGAMRFIAPMIRKYGGLTDTELANIVGPRAVASSSLLSGEPARWAASKGLFVRNLRDRAEIALKNEVLSGDEYKEVLKKIAQWEKGKVFDEAWAREGDALLDAVSDANPIANDGLVLLKSMYVPGEIVEQAKRVRDVRFPSREAPGFLGWMDWVRRGFKANVTFPFLGFHGRNLGNLWYQDVVVNGPKGVVDRWKDAWNLAHGKAINFKKYGFASQDELQSALSRWGDLHGAGDVLAEPLEPQFVGGIEHQVDWGKPLDSITGNVIGQSPLSLRQYGREAGETIKTRAGWNIMKPENFWLTKAGAGVANVTEQVGRAATMLGQLRKGATIERAAAISKSAHVDYSRLTVAERAIAQRLVPFYTYSRRILPFVIGNLMEKPGGIQAQTIRAFRNAEQETGFRPPQLGGSMAMPIGEEIGGTQRFLSQLDLPMETINRLLPIGAPGSDASNIARGLVAQTDPILKGITELAFGKSAFQGRNLSDLDSTTGRIAAQILGEKEALWKSGPADQLLAMSPLARYATTARTALDADFLGGRKDPLSLLANLSTGIKITDVDMEKSRGIAAGNAIKELLRDLGAKSIESVNFSKEELLKLPPDKREEAVKLQALIQSLRKSAKKAREAEKK